MQGGGGGSVSRGPNSEPGALSGIQMVAPVKRSSSPQNNLPDGQLYLWAIVSGAHAAVGGDSACSTACPEDDIDVHPQEPG